MAVNSVLGSQSAANYDYSSKVKKNDVKEAKNKSASSDVAAVYEKSEKTKPATYSINKMSQEERTQLVDKMKADAAVNQQKLVNLVMNMMGKQAGTNGIANGQDDDAIWKFLAKGDFTVDAATKAQAQEDISEDGYWGVKQTSQRLFDFASALAGDDPEKMKKMQDAMEKGFKEATKAWGKDLPDISKDTLDAANKLFEDFYKSKQTITE